MNDHIPINMSIMDKIFKKNSKKEKGEHDVFITYSSIDTTEADKVCHILEENNIKCWIAPRDITSGGDYVEEIYYALRNSTVQVLIFSHNANESKYATREIELAFECKKPIVAFRIDESFPYKTMDFLLRNAQWIDAYPPSEKAYELLVEDVLRLIRN